MVMAKPEQIPDKVVEAAAIAMWLEGAPHISWDETAAEAKQVFRRKARAALAAAIRALKEK